MPKVEEAFDIIKGMTIIELRDLNKKIEDEFGITAAAPMMMAPQGGGGGGAPQPRPRKRRRSSTSSSRRLAPTRST